MSYFTVTLKIKHTLKAADKDEAVDAFFSELREFYDAGELTGKMKVVKSNKQAMDDEEDDEEDSDSEE